MAYKLRYKVWIENDNGRPIIGEGRLRILSALRITGSMSKTARKLNLPFRNVWAKIKDAERQAGFKMVETSKTGSRLTEEAEELLALYAQLQRSCRRSANTKFRQIFSDGGWKPRSPSLHPDFDLEGESFPGE
jgi:molybdate transport system regulatory protein